MEGQRLILNNGIIIEDGRAGYSGGFLWCYITGDTMAEAAAIFLNAENTQLIVFHKRRDRLRKSFRIARRDDAAADDLRLGQVAVSADVGDDQRKGRVHRLQDRKGERLVAV